MRAIFRLAFAEWFTSKVWAVFVVLFIGAVVVGPLAVSSELDPLLAPPAINQATYAVLFLLCAFQGPMFAAELGRAQAVRSHRTFWRAQGVTDFRYYVTMLAAAAVPVIFICLAGALFMRVFGSSALSTTSLTQAVILTAAAFLVPLPLAVGLSQRGGASFAYAMAILAEIAGFYGPAMLNFVRQKPDLSEQSRVAVEALMTIIPQLRIGDQAERVTFAWGAAGAPEFLAALGYLLLCVLATGAIGYLLFQRRRA